MLLAGLHENSVKKKMGVSEGEYKEFLPQECTLLTSYNKKSGNSKIECGGDCMKCPAVESLGTASKDKDNGKSKEPQVLTGVQFVDRNLGLRHAVVYSAPQPKYELQSSPELETILKTLGYEDLEIWPKEE